MLNEIEEGISQIPTCEEKLYYAFHIWTIRPFEKEANSKVMREITTLTSEIAQTDIEILRLRFESILVNILKDVTENSKILSIDRVAHLMYSAVRGFKLAAKDSNELSALINDFIKFSLNFND